MPKRKRDVPLDALIPRLRTDIFHALKLAKGFERQRQSKRLADAKTPPEKKARIEKEVVVLKSLDLHHTAHAHLCTSLLKIKAIAERSDRLPEEIRAGVPKPDLTEEERVALHNVTSSLYNRAQVKQAVERAVEAVCRGLGVPVPEKKGKKAKKGEEEKTEDKTDGSKADDGPADKKEKAKEGKEEKVKDKADGNNKMDGAVKKEKKKAGQAGEGEAGEEGGKRPGKTEKKTVGKQADGADQAGDNTDMDEEEEEEEEKAVSQLDKMLGLDSGEESADEEEDVLVKGRTRKPSGKELDPMEITTDEDGSDEEDLDPMEVSSDEEGSSGSGDDFDGFSDAAEGQQSSASDDESVASEAESSTSSESRSPPPKKAKKAKGSLRPTDSTFLPTLMGGYISGSESASDIDVAPRRKNRRGQRARQAIWEKKYGDKARHLQKAANGRDAGWDPKRGAVDGESKPWKRGIRNPLLEKDKTKASGAGETKPADEKKQPNNEKKLPSNERKKPAQRKRDDTGPLHPSWEAKRKAKEKQQLSAPFQGKKIVFD
ncbi:hypothetical protein VTH06DRAFT_7163 [Thermothelomyces fergusii]